MRCEIILLPTLVKRLGPAGGQKQRGGEHTERHIISYSAHRPAPDMR